MGESESPGLVGPGRFGGAPLCGVKPRQSPASVGDGRGLIPAVGTIEQIKTP